MEVKQLTPAALANPLLKGQGGDVGWGMLQVEAKPRGK